MVLNGLEVILDEFEEVLNEFGWFGCCEVEGYLVYTGIYRLYRGIYHQYCLRVLANGD